MLRTQNKSLIPEIEYDGLRSWIRLILLFIVGVVGTVGMWSVVVVMPALETEFAIDKVRQVCFMLLLWLVLD